MTGTTGRRARTIEELGAQMGALHRNAGANFRAYEPQPGDVFLTSWAKSGTTMMQQMFHQLRMGAATGAGDMDFDDISRVVPWADTAVMLDLDLNAPQRGRPRGFKSHRDYHRLPPGMRYVVTLRDPKETYASFHRFFDGWQLEAGALSLEEFFPLWMMGGPNGSDYFTHLLSWVARREEADTLLVTYDWAASNRAAMIRRLADFLRIALTPELASLVEERTGRAYMHAHQDQFDDAMICAVMESKLGLPDADSTKVQAIASDAATLPDSVVERIDALWAERVAPVTGHRDFAALAAEVDALA